MCERKISCFLLNQQASSCIKTIHHSFVIRETPVDTIGGKWSVHEVCSLLREMYNKFDGNGEHFHSYIPSIFG